MGINGKCGRRVVPVSRIPNYEATICHYPHHPYRDRQKYKYVFLAGSDDENHIRYSISNIAHHVGIRDICFIFDFVF